MRLCLCKCIKWRILPVSPVCLSNRLFFHWLCFISNVDSPANTASLFFRGTCDVLVQSFELLQKVAHTTGKCCLPFKLIVCFVHSLCFHFTADNLLDAVPLFFRGTCDVLVQSSRVIAQTAHTTCMCCFPVEMICVFFFTHHTFTLLQKIL